MLMRLCVEVPVFTRNGNEFQRIPDTRVVAVRRFRRNGVIADDQVQVDAYVAPDYRRSIFAPINCWVTADVFRCYAKVADNRKSLRAFMESGDDEWRFE